jgi:hypothetical protein
MTARAWLETTLRGLRHVYGRGTTECVEFWAMSTQLGSTRSAPSTRNT